MLSPRAISDLLRPAQLQFPCLVGLEPRRYVRLSLFPCCRAQARPAHTRSYQNLSFKLGEDRL
jgi:hypothetical protein